jgi:hypothetical protein
VGFDLIGRHYYSPIPDLEALPPTIWARESEFRGVHFDIAAGLDFAQRELSAYISEYAPPRAATSNPGEFYLNNGFYESIDAEVLYAMVRRFAPSRIVELGSGMSTLVIADARTRNDRSKTRSHVVYDPYPRPDLTDAIEQVAELRPVGATAIPESEFQRLGAGDMLFVDTTHTVKIGGDVNRIVLDILPALAPGVLIHFHDVFLPYEYPREFLVDRSFFWAEQYLLQAFLAFNREFEILFAAHALQRVFGDEVARLVPSAGPSTRPAAFWITRVKAG